MANIYRQITLNSKGLKAGPFFDVYYSADCSVYTIATDGSNVYLPADGSTAIVTIPDDTQCLKLVNLSDTCGNNFVVENIGLTTTTTTTTSTTSTTTTIAPTTTTTSTTSTTTTLAPKFWNAVYCNDGTAVGVPLKMAGTATTGSVVQAGTGVETCASLVTVYVGTPIVFFDKTAATIYGSCSACGITTSTTTTMPPVWYNLYNCSNGQIETSTQYPAGTFSVNQRVVYGGALFFYVVSSTTSDPGGIKWNVTSAGSGLTGCPVTTSTTTTTTLAPVRLALTASCSGNNNVLEASNFRGGNGSYYSVASGSSESNAFTAQQILLSGASSYTFNNLPNGTWYVVLRDSLGNAGYTSASLACNTTSTTTTSTTTTIAPPPYSFLTNTGRNGSSAACSATKNIYVWSYTNLWDAGVTYYEGTISGATLPLSPYPGADQWFANGGNAIQIDDNGLSSNLTACPTTTTSTTTTAAPTTTSTTTTSTTTTSTSTTTLQPVWYNLYNCFDGSSTTSRQYTIGTFSVGQRVAYGTGGSILYFNVVSEVTSNPGGIQWDVYSVAGTGCPATTTTTTTTTIPGVDFTFSNYCAGGQGYTTITGLSGGAPGGTYEYSTNYGVNWYPATVGTIVGPFANGTNPNLAIRNTLGGGTNKALGVVSCATTTSTTTTTLSPSVLTCFVVSQNTTYTDGCNGFVDETAVYTVSLKDQYGLPINAPTTLTFTFEYDYSDIQDTGNTYGTATQDLYILGGSSSGQTTFYPKTYQYCNYSSNCDGSCYTTQTNIHVISNNAGISQC